jgi:hypothetical protein
LKAVNVERLISAVRLLRDSANHEAAPFVAAWKQPIEEFDTHPVQVDDSDIAADLSLLDPALSRSTFTRPGEP